RNDGATGMDTGCRRPHRVCGIYRAAPQGSRPACQAVDLVAGSGPVGRHPCPDIDGSGVVVRLSQGGWSGRLVSYCTGVRCRLRGIDHYCLYLQWLLAVMSAAPDTRLGQVHGKASPRCPRRVWLVYSRLNSPRCCNTGITCSTKSSTLSGRDGGIKLKPSAPYSTNQRSMWSAT